MAVTKAGKVCGNVLPPECEAVEAVTLVNLVPPRVAFSVVVKATLVILNPLPFYPIDGVVDLFVV